MVDAKVYIGTHKNTQVFAWDAGSADETTTVKQSANNQANGNDQVELDGVGDDDDDDDDDDDGDGTIDDGGA